MRVISYVSCSLIPVSATPNEIANIIDVAQKRNAEVGVTGVLIYENQHFFQTIEGPDAALDELFKDIASDPRHHEISTLIDEPVQHRFFSDWSLDTYYVDNPDLVSPKTLEVLRTLYVQNFGVDAEGLVAFVNSMLNEMDAFKIGHDKGFLN